MFVGRLINFVYVVVEILLKAFGDGRNQQENMITIVRVDLHVLYARMMLIKFSILPLFSKRKSSILKFFYHWMQNYFTIQFNQRNVNGKNNRIHQRRPHHRNDRNWPCHLVRKRNLRDLHRRRGRERNLIDQKNDVRDLHRRRGGERNLVDQNNDVRDRSQEKAVDRENGLDGNRRNVRDRNPNDPEDVLDEEKAEVNLSLFTIQ